MQSSQEEEKEKEEEDFLMMVFRLRQLPPAHLLAKRKSWWVRGEVEDALWG